MNLFKNTRIPTCSFIIAFAAFFVLFHGDSRAEIKQMRPANQMQIQKKEPASMIPAIKACPDLKVSLNVVKSISGLVTLNGTISNIGNTDYNIPSEAQYFMNLSYPPKTYNQIGVSEQLCPKAFTSLKKGASSTFNCTYQIPNFDGWAEGIMEGNAKRLFTLRAVKKDMSSFKTGEDCNPNNNSMGVEVTYQEKKH
jgi:hypothetical protein